MRTCLCDLMISDEQLTCGHPGCIRRAERMLDDAREHEQIAKEERELDEIMKKALLPLQVTT
jgi:hypothetical protein